MCAVSRVRSTALVTAEVDMYNYSGNKKECSHHISKDTSKDRGKWELLKDF